MLLVLVPRAQAQCSPAWLPGGGVPGVNGEVVCAATMWDPDGPGPLPPLLVVGGSFYVAGNIQTTAIAAWDGSTWSALGTGMSGGGSPYLTRVIALAVLPNGDLVAAGSFSSAGGVPCNNIARWNGSAWSPLGGGTNSAVLSLAVLPSGDLVAGGGFNTAGGLPVNSIARWSGSAWSSLGAGIPNGGIYALAVLPNGDLVAAGGFSSVGNNIARWNGSFWSALGTGTSSLVQALAVLPNGDLVAGGQFAAAGGSTVNYVARWHGNAWSSLGSGMTANGVIPDVVALTVLPNGDLVAGGRFHAAGGTPAHNIARWNGSAWSALGAGPDGADHGGIVVSLAVLPSGDLVAGGAFGYAGGVAASNVARWNGSAWASLGTGVPNRVYSLAVCPNGDLVAGGTSDNAGIGYGTAYVARWDGGTWTSMGTGNPGSTLGNNVSALAVLPNGDVVAAGAANEPNANQRYYISRWNGSAWSALGYPDYQAYALAVLPNGDLIASGSFSNVSGVAANHIARWNGSAWFALGPGGVGGSLLVLPNGDLLAAGSVGITRWNGSTWSAMGTLPPGIGTFAGAGALALFPNGDIATIYSTSQGGNYYPYIARWNGSAWSSIPVTFSGGGGGPGSLAALHNGDLVVGGLFTTVSGITANRVARWNGSTWSALGAGTNYDVYALATLANGDLAVAGAFTAAGGTGSPYFARWTTPTAPTISQQPAPAATCTGSAAFSITAAPPGVTYQWQRETGPNSNTFVQLTDGATGNGSFLSGSTTVGLSITGATAPDAQRYRCVVSNSCGSATSDAAQLTVNSADFNGDGDTGTDADIEAFFACLAGNCCATCGSSDFNADGDVGTDADIESFFRVLAGGAC